MVGTDGPVRTCACCGQDIPREEHAAARLSLRVDETVLALCNAAYADAAQGAHAHVEVAHLVRVLAESAVASGDLSSAGFSSRDLASSASLWLSRARTAGAGAEPVTSPELKALLQRAETWALQNGRSHAGIRDLIAILASLLGPSEATRSQKQDMDEAFAGDPMEPSFARTRTYEPAAQSYFREARVEPARGYRLDDTHATGHAAAGLSSAMWAARLTRLEALLATPSDAGIAVWRRGARDQTERGHARSGDSGTRNRSKSNVSRTRRSGRTTASTRSHLSGRRRLRRLIWRRRSRMRHPQPSDQQMTATHVEAVGPAARTVQPHNVTHAAAGPRILPLPANSREDDTGNEPRFYLAPDDEIVRAPSIGPKTAARLMDAGLATVRDLLAADPDATARQLKSRSITPQRLRDWQDQARLVCTIPWLRGTHAQLMVGAGLRSVEDLADADAGDIAAAVLRFAGTRDGQSVLRSGPPPDLERIVRWVENAARAEPQRAA